MKTITARVKSRESVDWSSVSIDAKIMIQASHASFPGPRHFAGIRNNFPAYWADGKTSWTTETWICFDPEGAELMEDIK